MSLTKQEAFTKAYLGLHAQGFIRSMNENGACAYRGENDCKCAVGHLIPDEIYDPAMDYHGGLTIYHLLGEYPELRLHLIGNSNFLRALQQVHDSHPDPEQMQEALHRFAAHHGLEVPNVPVK